MLVVIIVLAVFVATRLRRKEPLLPRNISDFRRTMRHSMHFGSVDNAGNDYGTAMSTNDLVSVDATPKSKSIDDE